MKNKSFTLIELLAVLAIVAMLSALALGAVGGCTQSNGSRVGIVTKFSNKGVAWKTWEGEMNLGGIRNNAAGDGSMANIWQFSVMDQEVVKAVDENIGKKMRLDYIQNFFVRPWNGSTTYFVQKAQVVE
jgi:prepilin-type N-terminal cleavage/methylation domain-containing protein